LRAGAQCLPDAWGRVSFLVTPLSLAFIDDANHPLRPWVNVNVPDLYRLLATAPMLVKGSDHVELKPK
jgi:hypothetical protein